MRCHLRRLLLYVSLAILTLIFTNILIWSSQFSYHSIPPPRFHTQLQSLRERAKSRPLDAILQFIRDPNQTVTLVPEVHVWPNNREEPDDRIPAQLTYIPRSLQQGHNNGTTGNVTNKVILAYNGVRGHAAGAAIFEQLGCRVQACEITADRKKGPTVDAVLWSHSISKSPWKKPSSQVWILSMLESPFHTPTYQGFRDLINWTATYRRDSTLVTPYERFVPHSREELLKLKPPIVKNYAANKTKKVAWFVSNCHDQNGRKAYAESLSEHIQVDIYGKCGQLKCPRHAKGDPCFKMLSKDYKFYLAFENSNCKDYITEKLYWNGLWNDVVPIVMGARPVDYELSAPPHSYIHVDEFESPAHLADYLHKLDANDDLYNTYFQWKGSGKFMNTHMWCRLCAMLHDDTRRSWYTDINTWWRGGNTCVRPRSGMKWATWRNKEDLTLKGPEPQQYDMRGHI